MDGIIIINKPKAYTSHDVVAKVKKILNVKKVGHTGTLDPNATGVLPLLLGCGTKLSKYLIEHDKEYEVTLKLGIKTDTADSEGKIIKECDFKLKEIPKTKIKDILNSFIGKQDQIPPMYSAIKVNGKKLYEYARSGNIESVDIKPRQIEIYEISLIDINNEENEIEFKVKCSKGTYIRSLCEDIADRLDTIGYMKELNRTQVGQFSIQQAVTVEKLENNKDNVEFLKKHMIKIEDFFCGCRNIILEDNDLQKFLNGVQLNIQQDDGIVNIYNKKTYIGIGMIKNKKLKREIIV